MTELYSGLHVGQRFASLEEFKDVIRSISVRQHWDLRVVRSNKKSVVLGCRSSVNCYFRVVCRANKNATYITSLQDGHSCRRTASSPGATPARSEASHVRFLLSEIPKLFDMNNKIRGQEVVDAVKRYHGYDISMRQAQRALTKLQPRRPRVHPDQAAHGEGDDEVQQTPHQAQASHEDNSGHGKIAENRWLHSQLPATLPPEGSVQPNSTQNNQTVSQQSHNQQVPTHTLGHPQDQRYPVQHLPPINMPQNTYTHPQSTHTALPPPDPKLQSQQQQQQTGHPAAPQLVLTNFKIEFTCTTCGSLNQSFFPNHGNIAGGNYLQHSSSTQNSIQSRPPTSVSNRRSSNDDGNTVGHHRDIPSTWTASGLEVPITSGNP